MIPTCGDRTCTIPAHLPPLARRIEARQPKPVERKGPAWMARLTAREMREAHG